jgi:hypothetical protein
LTRVASDHRPLLVTIDFTASGHEG